MSELAIALRAVWMPRLHQAVGSQDGDIHSWLQEGRYQLVAPLPGGATSYAFQISPLDPEEMRTSWSKETMRFAMTSFESFVVAHQGATGPVKRGEAWNNIKLYYSAYFAANAIIRSLGISCTYVSGETLQSLKRAAGAITPPGSTALKVERGVYRINAFDPTNTAEFLTLKGSAHEAFWRCFVAVLKEADGRIEAAHGTGRFIEERTKLVALTSLLTIAQSRGDWLSGIRNDINYRHEYGLWFPYKSNGFVKLVGKAKMAKLPDTDEIDLSVVAPGQVASFADVCKFLVALCRDIVLDVHENFHSGKFLPLANTMKCIDLLGLKP